MSDEPRRSRRSKKTVDYSKEQDFSDEDVFEDSPAEDPTPAKRGRPRSSRKSTGSRRRAAAQEPEDDGVDDEDVFRSNKPIYTEKGYDPNLPPIRERFPFLPEVELDGSPKIDLIVGRRPVDEKGDETKGSDEENQDPAEEEQEDSDDGGGGRRSRRRGSTDNRKKKGQESPKKEKSGVVEYEYLIKYKNRSYLHLEWKTGADLESMNKSAKTIYRRYLKKIAQGTDDDLENPEFDPSYVVPQKIVAEKEQEFTLELTDKELLKWEKQREKELAEESDEEDDDDKEKSDKDEGKTDNEKEEESKDKEDSKSSDDASKEKEKDGEADEEKKDEAPDDEWEDEIDFSELTVDRLKGILAKDDPYYPVVEGCDNPYRDGYVTEPPKKPRASYLFFQCTMRSYFAKRNPEASQGELMTILGNHWQAMSEQEQEPFVELAREEAKQYEKERQLMEKAQRPNEMWQPIRRCLMVLDRLAEDSFADIFLEPVDTDVFEDYEEVIDQPMDLGTVRTKLKSKKYQSPEQFARDVRKVWNNCKIYNKHGSAIWHVADYMSKQFERLYHAWVLEFRERYLRWANPRARPWEHTCRQCDGKCGTPDDDLVLCDHCDAMYGYKCLNPPLKKLPKGVWHCPDCKPKVKTARGVRMMSAVAENAARKRAELGDTPKRKVKQTMYLVKWAGLGYEHCTWETKQDIGNPALIAQFHKMNNSYPDEPDMPEEDVEKFLAEENHINIENAGGKFCIPDLRSQLYAQTRAFEFAKFGMDVPEKVVSLCGPKTQTSDMESEEKKGVLETLSSMVQRVSRSDAFPRLQDVNRNLPPLLAGEYDAVVPITAKGLMMNVGEINGSVAFLGYRTFPDGSKGPAEKKNLIRSVGDKIIAVDGISTVNKSFKEVIGLLRESGKNSYSYMRFLEARYSSVSHDLTSVGSMGRYAFEELQRKFSTDRKRVLAKRIEMIDEDVQEEEEEQNESDASAGPDDSDDESDGSAEFQPESDEEDVSQKELKDLGNNDSSMPESMPSATNGNGQAAGPEASKEADAEASESHGQKQDAPVVRTETTHSLARRLLGIDVGYSSDEGGDDEYAYYLDGVDSTFTPMSEVPAEFAEPEVKVVEETKKEDKKAKEEETKTLPVKRTEFSSLGDRAKLVASVALTGNPPDIDRFDNFPNPSSKAIAEKEAKENEAAAKEIASPEKEVKRSTVKVEQVDIATNEIIHVWANAQAAAATLQIPLNELRQVLQGDYDEELGDEVGGFRWRFAAAGATVTAGATDTKKKNKKGKEAWLEFRDRLYDPSEPHPYKNGNRLRDYQVEGVNWLASTYYRKHGCILADEMGLGKTVQIVCYLEHLFRVEKIHRPFLVVVPLSTVEHWRREFEGWTDMVCCVYHDRQRVWRDVLREYEWYYEDRPHNADYLKFDVLVTTYDTLIGDFDVISTIPWRVTVVDEAHRLRNQKGKLLECMKEISAKGTLQYGFQSRVLMSGTPLQNDLIELWTLLNFIEPFKFPDLDQFMMLFGNMANREQVEALQQSISPYMLRRVKEDVAKDIPNKEETVIDVELTSIQKQYYRAIFEHNHAFLNMGATRTNAPKLMNIQMELRKVCNHPCLLEGVEHREQDRLFKEFVESGDFEGKTPEQQQRMVNESLFVQTSGKMVLMDKLLPKLRQEGHKVLIFSQMVRMLDLISDYCEFRSFPYERLDGRVRGTDRQKSIDRFERDPNSFLFLLSTRAGGVGINLTAADICIIFDSDWNPQNDVQAQARCHRIGQTKDVRIYRLITSRSFEQEMFDRASKKLGLEQAVLGTFGQDEDDDKPTTQEMEQLLKKGAYALIEDENDEITKAFCADDIDSILAKRTRTRVVEGAKTASWLNKQGMVVSKSKFTSDSKSADLDMDDPLFWQKVMPDFVTPTLMLQKLDDLEAEVTGIKKKKKGRGRGRWKKKEEPEKEPAKEEETEQPKEPTEDEAVNPEGDTEAKDGDNDEEMADAGDDKADDEDAEADKTDDDEKGEDEFKLTRTNQKKVAKFVTDLKAMMEGIFDEEEDESLPEEEKQTCQKLLLTMSVKEKLFNEEQRHMARVMLKRLEGSRRRRCRTSDQQGGGAAFSPGRRGRQNVREELLIVSKKKKQRRKRRRTSDNESSDVEIGDDGYKVHSDDEAEWSDVGEDFYEEKKRPTITRKEANRRRAWAVDDDAATAAGRTWPVLPRSYVADVLGSLLDEVIKNDEIKGGVFSEPVSKDEFPEYYEQISQPMDYGTMKDKLDKGEYRSAQAMQKDFVLVMQNCLKFNAPDSEIVQEARQQALMRPSLLRNAAMKHGLFLAEDGSVFEILDDDKKKSKKDNDGSSKKKGKRKKDDGDGTSKKKRKKRSEDPEIEVEEEEDDVPLASMKKKKPRIKISLGGDDGNEKPKKRRRKASDDDDEEEEIPPEESEEEKAPKKRGRANGSSKKSKKKKRSKAAASESEEEQELEEEDEEGKAESEDGSDEFEYLDPAPIKLEREALDGTFEAAKEHFQKRGVWSLPPEMKPEKFKDVATGTLNKMSRLDRYSVFAEPVSESEAPGYFDVVKEPMDMSTMRDKLDAGDYGEGDKAAAKFYKDFKLMFENCAAYNDEDGEVLEEASRLLGLVPETYATHCASVLKKQKKKG